MSTGETIDPCCLSPGQNKPGRVACVVPVYNHAEKAAPVIRKIIDMGFPVFVVDDGSTDPASRKLDLLQGAVVVRHEENRGKGAALLTGFAEAAKVADWAITIDGDGQHDPSDIARLVDVLTESNRGLVVGRRSDEDLENAPWTSRFGRKFSNFWVRVSGGQRLADTQSGFRVYPLPEILDLNPRARRFQFEVEILVLASWASIPVVEAEVGVVYDSARVSHFRPFVDFWRNFFTFTRLIAWRVLSTKKQRARWARRSGKNRES